MYRGARLRLRGGADCDVYREGIQSVWRFRIVTVRRKKMLLLDRFCDSDVTGDGPTHYARLWTENDFCDW